MERVPLKVLVVEDSEEDADLVMLELQRGGFEPEFVRVETAEAMRAALQQDSWDLVVSDYSMPRFTMPAALSMVQETGRDVPFVIVSATIGEEAAVQAMKAGAHDYILKHKLARLVPAVQRELRECEIRRERRQIEESLRHAQKLESIGVLAGGVAHDFNNLLTGILGNTSLAIEAWQPPPEARELLDDVVRAVERAADLTRQLLAYAGKGRYVIEPVNVSTLVREITDLIRTSVSKRVQLMLDLEADLPAVEADACQLQQLVMNLVLNGSEAIGERSGAVMIGTGVRYYEASRLRAFQSETPLDAGTYVYIEVRDTGDGMDPQTKARIFEPFFSTKFTGRGLGLAAALGIVRSHRGGIRVQSTVGEGSSFEVILPAAQAHLSPRAVELGSGRELLFGSGAILVVDDEPVVRRTARATLERYGYSVLEAANGREALEVFSRNREQIVLVLLDLTMPVMAGEETYRELRNLDTRVDVVVSSGYDEAEAASRFSGQGPITFLKKPYTSAKLAEKVKAAMSRQLRRAAG